MCNLSTGIEERAAEKIIVYYIRKKTAEFRGKEAFIYEDVTVHTVGGEL